jgi:hypothetical protein
VIEAGFVDPGLVNIRNSMETPIARTIELQPGLNVDLNADGHVVCVERVEGAVSVDDLTSVLRAIPFAP